MALVTHFSLLLDFNLHPLAILQILRKSVQKIDEICVGDNQDTLLRMSPAIPKPSLERPNSAHHLFLGFLVRQILGLQKIANRLLVFAAEFREDNFWGRDFTQAQSLTCPLHYRTDNHIIVASESRCLRLAEFGEVTVLFGVIIFIIYTAAVSQKSHLHGVFSIFVLYFFI